MINLQTTPENLPVPQNDGAADHLLGMGLADVVLQSTNNEMFSLATLSGTVVIYTYPMTGQPDIALPDGWDEIPGARGCTPQSCSFRDHMKELQELGCNHVIGISTQTTQYQKEAADRLHLPFSLLSDNELVFQKAMNLPTMTVNLIEQNNILLKRLALIVREQVIVKVFYPVFPPHRSANDVLDWLRHN